MSAQSSTRTRGTRAARRQRTPENAYYEADMSDSESFEQWQDRGGLDAAQRANRRWKQLLQDYQAPALDESIDEALLAFIANEKRVHAGRVVLV